MRKQKKNYCPLMDADLVVIAQTTPAPVKKKKLTAQERINALSDKGVDVSHLMAMHGALGGECIVSNKNGRLTVLEDDDPIFNYIKEKGTVPNRSLFRRFLPAQVFHMLSYTPFGEREPLGMTKMIHNLGYEYPWKMLIRELEAQKKMEKKDPASFRDRNRWFNVNVVTAMAEDYIAKLKERVEKIPVRYCKRIPYKRVGGRDIFVEDLESKLYSPLILASYGIRRSTSAAKLYSATKIFNDLRIAMKWDTPQCVEWIDAYKGAGAFYTMQNLLRFHNCYILNDAGNCLRHPTQTLAYLGVKAEEYKYEGWRLLAVLKKMLRDNGIDVKAKVEEWRN